MCIHIDFESKNGVFKVVKYVQRTISEPWTILEVIYSGTDKDEAEYQYYECIDGV
jgi:hypothetical protein